MKEWMFQWENGVQGGFLGISRPKEIPFDDWVTLKQVHGDEVVVLRRLEDLPRIPTKGDAILCEIPGIKIAVKTADCVPILWAHPGGIVAAVHAGWKGSLLRILQTSLRTLRQIWGLDPAGVRMAIGPAISGKVYEVGAEVAGPIQDIHPECVRPYGKKYLLDLKEFNRREALESGVPESAIAVHEPCTFSDERFFSHRRAQKLGLKNEGRNYSFIFRSE